MGRSKGRFDFNDDVWTAVSADAKDMIRQLLVVDPAKRLTLEQVSLLSFSPCIQPISCLFKLCALPFSTFGLISGGPAQRLMSGLLMPRSWVAGRQRSTPVLLHCIASPDPQHLQVFEHPWCKTAAGNKQELLKVRQAR